MTTLGANSKILSLFFVGLFTVAATGWLVQEISLQRGHQQGLRFLVATSAPAGSARVIIEVATIVGLCSLFGTVVVSLMFYWVVRRLRAHEFVRAHAELTEEVRMLETLPSAALDYETRMCDLVFSSPLGLPYTDERDFMRRVVDAFRRSWLHNLCHRPRRFRWRIDQRLRYALQVGSPGVAHELERRLFYRQTASGAVFAVVVATPAAVLHILRTTHGETRIVALASAGCIAAYLVHALMSTVQYQEQRTADFVLGTTLSGRGADPADVPLEGDMDTEVRAQHGTVVGFAVRRRRRTGSG